MSASRSSWRPQQRHSKTSRRLLIAGGSVPLIAILVLLAALFFQSPAAPVQLVILAPPNPEIRSLVPNATAQILSEKSVAEIFNPQHQPELQQPIRCSSESELRRNLQSLCHPPNAASQLLIYASVRPRNSIKDGQPILVFQFGNDEIPAADLFTEIATACNARPHSSRAAVILLDLLDVTVGLEGGLSARDANALIKAAVEPHQQQLAVICSCSDGQRSWELPQRNTSSTPGSPSTATPLDVDIPESAFCTAVANTLLKGHTESAKDFHAALSETVKTSVDNAWRQPQTPSPIFGNQNATVLGSLRLRSKLDLPATLPAVADATSPAPAAPPETPAVPGDPAKLAPAATVAVHWNSLDSLNPLATQLFPARILRLRADLLRLSLAVNSGNNTAFTTESERIKAAITQLNDELLVKLNPTKVAAAAAAFAAPTNAPAPTATELDAARRLIDTLTRPEPPALPTPQPPSLYVISSTLWSELANRPDPQTLERLHRFFNRFPPASWPSGSIPWQLTLLHNTLTSAKSATPEIQTLLLRSADQIRNLRENTLLLLAGFSPKPDPSSSAPSTPTPAAAHIPEAIRTLLRSDETHGLNRILNQLSAAEAWLAAGQLGRFQVQNRINAAQTNFNSALQQLSRLNTIQQCRWFQKSVLPAIVQAAALRQERKPFDSTAFDRLKELNALTDTAPDDPQLTALFRLTAPLQLTSAPEDSSQYDSDLNTLKEFLISPDNNSPSLTATDLLELTIIPPNTVLPVEQRPSWPKLRDRILAAAANTSQSATATSSQTGLWVGFWSLRLLEATSEKPSSARKAYDELFSLIGQRLDRQSAPSETTPEILRAKLFHILAQEWQQLASQPAQAPAVFPSDEQLAADFLSAINSQVPANTPAADLLSPTIPDFIASVSPRADAFAFSGPNQVFINQDQSASCELAVPAGAADSARFLIHCSNWKLLSPQPVNIEADQDGWFELPARSEWPNQNKLILQLQPLQPLPSTWQSSVCRVAVVNADDSLNTLHMIQIQARPETQWQLATAANSPELLPESISNPYAPVWLLNLPPETAAEKPLTIPFNLRQSAGPQVSRIRLQLLRLSAAKQPHQPLPGWEQPIAIDLTPGQPLPLPLMPPSAPAAAPQATPAVPQAPAAPFSLDHGFCVRVFPEIATASQDQAGASPSSLLTVVFRLPEFSQLVDVTAPSFDPVTRRLSLSLRPIGPNTSGPVPAELHLSPGLQQALVAQKLNTQKIAPAAFDSPDAQAIRRAQPVPRIPDITAAPDLVLEFPQEQDFSGIFSLSAAGFPFARAWKLSHDSTSVQTLDIPESDPESRLQLEVLSSNSPPAATYPELVFRETLTADGKPVMIRVGIHLHEIKLEPAAEPRLRWNLQQHTPIKRLVRASKPDQEPLYSSTNRRISASASPAPVNAWNLACSTTVLTPFEVPLTELDAGSAKYELTFTLERRNTPDLTAVLPFTIDRAQPPEALVTLPAILDRAADPPPVATLDRIADSDTRILKVEAGLDPAKLEVLWPRQNSRLDDPSPEKLDITSLLSPEKLPPVAPGLEIPATLHFKLTDAAGNVRIQEKSFRISSGMQNAPLGEAPPASITVEVAPNVKGKFKVTLTQKNTTQEASSARPARFENLPAGKYTIEWLPIDQKLSGNYVGNKTVALIPAAAPPPATPRTPPSTPPAVPPGTIPPQKIVIGQ